MRTAPASPETLRFLDALARWLDDAFPIPFTRWRFGFDFLLGLIPGVGDVVAAVFGVLIVAAAAHARVPAVVVARMGLLVLADALLGLVPFLGDAADIFLKSNRRNLETFRAHAGGARQPGFVDYAIVGGVLLALLLLIVGAVAVAWFALTTLARALSI